MSFGVHSVLLLASGIMICMMSDCQRGPAGGVREKIFIYQRIILTTIAEHSAGNVSAFGNTKS